MISLTRSEVKLAAGLEILPADEEVPGSPAPEIPAEEGPAVIELLYAGGPGTVTARTGDRIDSRSMSPGAPGPIPANFDELEVTGAPFQLGVRTAAGVFWSEPIDPNEAP